MAGLTDTPLRAKSPREVDVAFARLRQLAHDERGGEGRLTPAQFAQVAHAFDQAGILRGILVAGFSGTRRQFPHVSHQLFAQRRPLRIERLLARDFFRRRHFQNGAVEIVPLRLAGNLVHIVEVGEDLVKLLLGDRVELVIVAARAAERQPEKCGAGGGHAVHDRLHAVLLEIDAAFIVARRIAMEAGGDQLIHGRVRQHVARDLFDRELVERHVVIQRIDDPVAIFPDLARGVDGVAVGIGVARHIEPMPAPSLAVMRRSQQSIDDALIGIGSAHRQRSLESPGAMERARSDRG